jgi:hypothetical protein
MLGSRLFRGGIRSNRSPERSNAKPTRDGSIVAENELKWRSVNVAGADTSDFWEKTRRLGESAGDFRR